MSVVARGFNVGDSGMIGSPSCIQGVFCDTVLIDDGDQSGSDDCRKEDEGELVPPDPDRDLCWNISDEILHSCEVWIRSNWNLSGQPLIKLIQNPHIFDAESTVAKRFYHAMKLHDLRLGDESFIFSWHGTTAKNVSSICRTGFDPYLRYIYMYSQKLLISKKEKIM